MCSRASPVSIRTALAAPTYPLLVIPMETIGYSAKSGTSLDLQTVATTVAYSTPRLGGSVDFSRVALLLPTVRGLTVLQGG